MKDFKEIYKAPFTDTWGTVTSDNDVHAFTFTKDVREEARELIIKALNGEVKMSLTPEQQEEVAHIFYKESYIYAKGEDNNDIEIISIRGFGHLTGIGGLKLSDEVASEIQDNFGEYIVSIIKGEQVAEYAKSTKIVLDRRIRKGRTIHKYMQRNNLTLEEVHQEILDKVCDLPASNRKYILSLFKID
mgnify:CR=1 FL=1